MVDLLMSKPSIHALLIAGIGEGVKYIIPINYDPVNGSDPPGAADGLGLTTGAFKTAQQAFVVAHDFLSCNNNQITILGASGAADTTGVHLPYWGLNGGQGGDGIKLDLNGGSIAATGGAAIDCYFEMQCSVRNGTIGGNAGGGVSVSRGARVQIEDGVTFAACASGYRHMQSGDGGLIEVLNDYSISGGADFHMVATLGGVINGGVKATLIGSAASITFADYVCFAQSGGIINAPSSWVNGAAVNAAATVSYSASYNAIILGASSVPGSAGSTSAGGQVS